MTDLTEFLLARIAEDEAVARDAADVTAPPWRWQHLPPPLDYGLAGVHPIQGGLSVIVPSRSGDMWPDRDPAAHIARWDPARVLAECEAKRTMIKRARKAIEAGDYVATTGGSDRPEARSDRTWYLGAGMAWQQVLRLLALPYADHSDYRQEWKP